MVFGVVRSAKGVPGGIFEKPVEKVCVNAASGGAASGKESLPLAMKRAVEIGAMILRDWETGAVGRVGTRSAVVSRAMGRARVCGLAELGSGSRGL
jgi:hypothetical protein